MLVATFTWHSEPHGIMRYRELHSVFVIHYEMRARPVWCGINFSGVAIDKNLWGRIAQREGPIRTYLVITEDMHKRCGVSQPHSFVCPPLLGSLRTDQGEELACKGWVQLNPLDLSFYLIHVFAVHPIDLCHSYLCFLHDISLRRPLNFVKKNLLTYFTSSSCCQM
jgi:hypothetical protein